MFNETFQFGVPLNELHARKLHFSVYDFDRFSRHDLIGQVVVDNLLDFSEGSGDKPVWRDIVEGTAVRVCVFGMAKAEGHLADCWSPSGVYNVTWVCACAAPCRRRLIWESSTSLSVTCRRLADSPPPSSRLPTSKPWT